MVDDQVGHSVDNDDENMWCGTVLLCHASFNGTTNKLPQAAPLSPVCFLSSCGNGDDLGHDVEKMVRECDMQLGQLGNLTKYMHKLGDIGVSVRPLYAAYPLGITQAAEVQLFRLTV